MKKLEFIELKIQDLNEVNGGHVPTSWYMDDATIRANGNNMATFFGFFYGVLQAFVS
jgi:hypothetical protein